MQEPSLSHISTQPSVQLSQISSSGSTRKQTVIHISQDMVTESDEVCLAFAFNLQNHSVWLINACLQHQREKETYPSMNNRQVSVV